MRFESAWKRLAFASGIVIPASLLVFAGAFAVDEGTAGRLSALLAKPFSVLFWMPEAVRLAGIDDEVAWSAALFVTPVFWIVVLERALAHLADRRAERSR